MDMNQSKCCESGTLHMLYTSGIQRQHSPFLPFFLRAAKRIIPIDCEVNAHFHQSVEAIAVTYVLARQNFKYITQNS